MSWNKNLSWPILAAAIAITSICPSMTAFGQEAANGAAEKTETAAEKADDEFKLLTIGSKAPDLDIKHWLSNGNGAFSEVTKLESGKVYVVEFWATWCGPCIGSMPHLVETQKKYADKGVQIISVSDEDLETVQEFLEKEFEGDEEDGPKTYGELTSAYCLTCDPDSSVEKDYFRAAAQNGIPCCFIVGKSGLIEWLGHPLEMDKPLAAVVDGSWDREKMGAAIRKEQEAALEQAKFQEKAGPAFEKLQAGEMEEGLKMLAAMLPEASPVQKSMIHGISFQVQMQQENHDEAAKSLVEMANCEGIDPQMINQFTWTIFEMSEADKDFSKPLIDAATIATEKAVAVTPDDGMILDTLAHLLHKQGNLDRAIEVQTKALKNPGPAEADIKAFLEQLKKEKSDK